MMEQHLPRQKNVTLFFLCLAYATSGIMSSVPGTTLLLLAEHTNVTLELMGLSLTCSALGLTCGVFLAGPLTTWIKPKYLLITAIAIAAFSLQILFFTHSYQILLITEFVSGIAFAFSDVILNITMPRLFPESLGRALNMLHSSFGIGALTGPLLVAASFHFFQDATFAYGLGSGLGCLAILFLFGQNIPSGSPATAGIQSLNAKGRTMLLLKQSGLWLLILQVFLYVGAEGGFAGWIVTVISTSATVSVAVAAPAATMFWLGLTLGRLGSAQLFKRSQLQESTLLIICFLGASFSGLILAFLLWSVSLAFGMTLLTGLFLGPIYPILIAMSSRRFSYALTTASTMMLLSARASGIVFPVVIGALITNAGTIWSMILPAGLLALTLLPFWLLQRQRALQSATEMATQMAINMHTMKEQEVSSLQS